MEQTRRDRRWTLTVAPLGTAVVFLSVLLTASAHDLAFTVALSAFSFAVPLLALIAFLTSLGDATKLPHWWEVIAPWLLLVGYVLIVGGIGALLGRVNSTLLTCFAALSVGCLIIAAVALYRGQLGSVPQAREAQASVRRRQTSQ